MSCDNNDNNNNNNNLRGTRQEQEVIRSSLDGKKAFLSSNQVFFWFKERSTVLVCRGQSVLAKVFVCLARGQ